MLSSAGEVAVIVGDRQAPEVGGGVAGGVHTIMHEHSVGEILVHPFDAYVEDVFYPFVTCEDLDDLHRNKRPSRSGEA